LVLVGVALVTVRVLVLVLVLVGVALVTVRVLVLVLVLVGVALVTVLVLVGVGVGVKVLHKVKAPITLPLSPPPSLSNSVS
jgi:hypothetical protein